MREHVVIWFFSLSLSQNDIIVVDYFVFVGFQHSGVTEEGTTPVAVSVTTIVAVAGAGAAAVVAVAPIAVVIVVDVTCLFARWQHVGSSCQHAVGGKGGWVCTVGRGGTNKQPESGNHC